jgi:hypothetical protein
VGTFEEARARRMPCVLLHARAPYEDPPRVRASQRLSTAQESVCLDSFSLDPCNLAAAAQALHERRQERLGRTSFSLPGAVHATSQPANARKSWRAEIRYRRGGDEIFVSGEPPLEIGASWSMVADVQITTITALLPTTRECMRMAQRAGPAYKMEAVLGAAGCESTSSVHHVVVDAVDVALPLAVELG